MYNCGKFGFGDIFNKKPDYYSYSDDGNKKITKDAYGKPITEATIEKVIEYLEKVKSKKLVELVVPLLALLKSFNQTKLQNLAVLHYGD